MQANTTRTGSTSRLREFAAHLEAITKLAISQDGDTLATFAEDNKLRVWRFHDFTELVTISLEEAAIGLALLDNGSTLACIAGNRLTFWSVTNQLPIFECSDFSGPQKRISFCPEQQLILLQEERSIRIVRGAQ